MNTLKMAALVLLSGLMASPAANSSVIGTLSYNDPTGTVGPNDTIEVWATLTLDPSSDPLTYDPNEAFPNGFNQDDIPTEAYDYNSQTYVPFDSYSYIGALTSRNCDDTFTVSCSSPGSQYTYTTPSTDSWFDFSGTINPGESLAIHLYTLTPTGGGAQPGVYRLFNSGVGFSVYGLDANDNELEADVYSFSANCFDDSCAFTRTVVPVPAAAWLFGGGLGLLGLVRRRLAG